MPKVDTQYVDCMLQHVLLLPYEANKEIYMIPSEV